MQLYFNFIKHELNKIKARLQNALRHTHKKRAARLAGSPIRYGSSNDDY